MKYLIFGLIFIIGCTHKQNVFQSKDLGKFISMQRVEGSCGETDKSKCVVQKEMHENGYVLFRKNGNVAGVVRN